VQFQVANTDELSTSLSAAFARGPETPSTVSPSRTTKTVVVTRVSGLLLPEVPPNTMTKGNFSGGGRPENRKILG
jgi:hypothetical protein